MSKIGLSEVVQNLRQELQEAVDEGEGKDLRFGIEDLELELQVGVTKSAGVEGEAGGGVKFWVFEAKASGKGKAGYESSQLQRIRLRLRPEGKGGGKVKLGGR